MANPYQFISNNSKTFYFVSDGKEKVVKQVSFRLIDKKEKIYNLSLCTVLENGDIDCETATRNGDMQRILETIAVITLKYTAKYPDRKIYFRGSDKVRTRQYQLSMFSRIQSILNLFDIEGYFEISGVIEKEIFLVGKNYDAFLLTKKTT